MKCIKAVVNLLFVGFVTEIYGAGTGTELDPFQNYVKQGQEAVLQCIHERNRLKWEKKNDTNIIIASENNVIDPTKYKVSVTSTGLYYRLHVKNAQPNDEGIYFCRGGNDTYYIQLILYVPPTRLYFVGSMDNKLENTAEGTDLLIRCRAEEGKPPPDVSIINSTTPNGKQEVSYTIPKISRDFHQKSIVCEATSAALDNPMTATVHIYLNLEPLTPIFKTKNVSTVETAPLRVSCVSYGSRPAATFTWTISGNDVASNFTTSQSDIAANDTNTVTSRLEYNVNRSYNEQTIKCKASNTVGFASALKKIDVKYAPDIKVNSPIYTQNDDIRTVTCNPSGNPDSYTYNKWQHKTKYGEIIREFDGNKTLKLSNVSVANRYQDSGEYVCTASNGIKDKDNKLEQTGYGYVTMHAQPVITNDAIDRDRQFGEISKAVNIYVNVYSVPQFTSFEWSRDRNTITTENSAKYETSSSPTNVKDMFHGKEVQLAGYNVTLTIHGLKAEDFTNYTVTLRGGFKEVMHTIILESASRPDTPGNFSMITSSSTSITVQWDPNSGGGYKQTFYIQYRVQGSTKWSKDSAGEEDINEQRRRRTYEVKSLQERKAYELRMFAENTAMKRSNFTDVLIELTRSSDAGSSTGAVIGGVAGCLIATIIVLLVIVCVLKKRKERATPSMKLRTSSEAEEDDGLKDNILYESSQSDGLKTNALYQSAGPDFESQNKTSTSCEYAVVQKPNAIYAEVNKDAQPKKVKAKKQKVRKEKPKKDKQVKPKAVNNKPEDEYANSALPLRNLNEEEYSNSTDAQGPSGHHNNAQGLEYADLTFRHIPAKNKKQVIHGNDDRTIYADVDHTKKAPPPPQESEYEETNIKHGKIA